MSLFERAAEKLGFVSKRTLSEVVTQQEILADTPREYREELRKDFEELRATKTVADPNKWHKKRIEIENKIEKLKTIVPAREDSAIHRASKAVMGGYNYWNYGGPSEYKPAGSTLWQNFPNTFETLAWLYENYYAFKCSVDLIRNEVESGGLALKGAKNVSEQRIMEVYKLLKMINAEAVLAESIEHSMVFGNSFIFPDKDGLFGNKVELKVLSPVRLYPIFNVTTEEIVGYRYFYGSVQRVFLANEILHYKMNSVYGKQLGCPPILPAVLEIETALNATSLENTVFQKGGMLGAIIGLEPPGSDEQSFAPAANEQWENLVNAKLNQVAGNKGGFGWMALSGKLNVHKFAQPGDFKANYLDGKEYVAKVTCECLGVPCEKIGIPRSAALQYSPSLVEDSVNAQLDATINRHTYKQAQYFNREVLEKIFGIYDVKLVPARRTGAKTKTATEALRNLATGGGWLTRNEGRTEWLHMPPLPLGDERGLELVDASGNRKEGVTPPQIIQPGQDPDFSSLEDMDSDNPDAEAIENGLNTDVAPKRASAIQRHGQVSDFYYEVKFGGLEDGSIQRKRWGS